MFKNSMMLNAYLLLTQKLWWIQPLKTTGYSAEDLIYLKKWEGEMSIIKNGNGIIGIDGDFNKLPKPHKYYQASTLVRQPSLVLEEQRYPSRARCQLNHHLTYSKWSHSSENHLYHTQQPPRAQHVFAKIYHNKILDMLEYFTNAFNILIIRGNIYFKKV